MPPGLHPTVQDLWPQLQAVADELGMRLGSPAAAPCGEQCLEPNPFVWLDEFFERCVGAHRRLWARRE